MNQRRRNFRAPRNPRPAGNEGGPPNTFRADDPARASQPAADGRPPQEGRGRRPRQGGFNNRGARGEGKPQERTGQQQDGRQGGGQGQQPKRDDGRRGNWRGRRDQRNRQGHPSQPGGRFAPGGDPGRGASPASGPPQPVFGVLEVLEQGYGFLRRRENNYLPGDGDVYVPGDMIRSLELMEGMQIDGMGQPGRGNNGAMSLVQLQTINGLKPEDSKERLPFQRVISLDPNQRIRLETTAEEISMRALDLITPIGKGQRGLIVAPPKTGKTTLLKKIANAVTTNHPEMELVVLLVDERPEEVTDFSRSVRGEVIASSSDEMARNHVSVAEIVIEKAKRSVEFSRDTIILLDSLTRLSRAYNVEQRGSGKILSGGIDSRTMERPKKFFGAARNAEQGGSLTIIATALIDTGSRMDEVIFQEFKGTGNMELQLDRRMFERRVFPCVDISLSGTRKEEKLFEPEELLKVQKLRRALSGFDPLQAMEKLLKMLERTGSNAEFLAAIS